MDKKTPNPFAAIDKSRFPKDERTRRRREAEAERARQEAEERARQEAAAPPADEDVFSSAMSGVAPLGSKGRKVPPGGQPVAPAGQMRQNLAEQDDDAASQLMDLVTGRVEFDLQFTDEYIRAQVTGLDPKIMARLRAGSFSTEAHLDLHGLNSDQAYGALLAFIRDSYLSDKRCLLLIPGRGKNSADGCGVLREKVQRWLTRDPFKRVVLAFCTALPKHGGAGALYVLLRKQKKTQGRILWDRLPYDEELI